MSDERETIAPPIEDAAPKPVPRGPAPFDWRGYPGVPLSGVRRSLFATLAVPLGAVLAPFVLVLAVYRTEAFSRFAPDARALAQLLTFAVAYAVWFGLAMLGGRHQASPAERIAMRPFDAVPGVIAAVVAMALGFWVQVTYGGLFVLFGIEVPPQPSVTEVFPVSPIGIAVAVLVACVLAPLAEEAVFRGVLYAGLRDRFGETVGVTVSAAAFAVSHFSWFVLVPFFVLGVLFARITAQSRSIWPAVIAHALFNLVALVLTYVSYYALQPGSQLLHLLGAAL